MPAWVTVSVAEIESALLAPELTQLREAALGDNSPDPIVGAISDVIARVRGYSASRPGNVLDRDQTLIPPELHQDAIWLVIQTLKLRLGVATPLSEDQRTRVRSAEQDLKDVALGRLLISSPLNPDSSYSQQAGGGAEVLPPRPRRFGGVGDGGYRPRISSGQTLGQAGIVDGVSNTGHYFCPPWLVGVDYSIIVNKPTTVADSGIIDALTSSALAAAVAGLLSASVAAATYAPKASPIFTGTPAAPTAAVDVATTQVATTAYVVNQGYLKSATAAATYATLANVATLAPLASPALSGVPTAPTAAPGTATTQIATTAFVGTAVANLVNSSPAALDTLAELAAALGNDASFATTITNALALKATIASPTFTGTPAAPTAAVDTSTTQIATTAFVLGQAAAVTPAMNGTGAVGTSTRWARADHVHPSDTTRAPLASPSFTGTVTIASAGLLQWGTDLTLLRSAANQLAIRNGTNASGLEIYNTYTSSSVWEKAVFDFTTNPTALTIGTYGLGGGTARNLWLQPSSGTGVGIGAGWVNDSSVILHSKPAAGSTRAIWVQESNNNGTGLGIQFRGLNQAGSASIANLAVTFGAAGADNTFFAFAPTNGSTFLRYTQNFNLGLNGGSFGSGSGVFFIATALTEPTVAPTAGALIYVSAAGDVKALTKAGNFRTIAAV